MRPADAYMQTKLYPYKWWLEPRTICYSCPEQISVLHNGTDSTCSGDWFTFSNTVPETPIFLSILNEFPNIENNRRDGKRDLFLEIHFILIIA